jgi:two-component system, OmpR family, sensor histidine kinase BaeS
MLSNTQALARMPQVPLDEIALWACSVVVAFVGCLWLYDALPGINWTLCTLLAIAAFMCFGSLGNRRLGIRTVVPLVLAGLLASCAAVTANLSDEVLTAVATLFALGAAIAAAHVESVADAGAARWVTSAPYAAILTGTQSLQQLDRAIAAICGGRANRVLRGIAIAAPVTALLALLLSAADPVFAEWRQAIVTALCDLSILPRAAFFVLLAAGMLGSCGIALRERVAPGVAHPAAAEGKLGDTERLIVTGAVAALFAIFLLLQVSYLFGNPGGRVGSGLSYADAVHRGFVELTVASSLCGALLLLLHRHGSPHGAHIRWVRGLEIIVIIQAQILLLSAFQRVNLYEAAYGFTLLRLDVQAYAAVAFVALILLALELRGAASFDRWLRRVLVVAALSFCGLVWGNADAWVARQNLQRYAQNGQLDVNYLVYGLGADAVPEIERFLSRLPSPLASRLQQELATHYEERLAQPEQHWFEWSLRRAALDRSLARIGKLPGTPAPAASP